MSELTDAAPPQDFFAAWQKRLKALRNVPPLLRMIWQSGPTVVTANVLLRIVAAVIPLAILAVTRLIINEVEAISTHQRSFGADLWWLIALEFAIAGLNSVLCRVIDFLDALFADKFTLHISTRIMNHASSLDLSSYENPSFYDKLERARVQSTDRLNMVQSMGRILQQVITASTLSISIFMFSLALSVAASSSGKSSSRASRRPDERS